jgi:pimeloyl-ACP methyl ester carboxylesterase
MVSGDEVFDIPVGGQRIVGTLLGSEGKWGSPGVLFVHGWGGRQEQYVGRARAIGGLGCICLTFDLRGHVMTHPQHDSVTREDNLQDVLAAYDVLSSRPGIDARNIALVGSSYGAYLAAIVSGMRPVRYLALRVPALYKDEGWDTPKTALRLDPDFDAFRRRDVGPADNRALCACAEFRGDVLVVESENDEIIPPATVKNYLRAFGHARSLTHRVMEGADHGLSAERHKQAYTNLLVGWMAQQLKGVRTLFPASRPGFRTAEKGS